MSFMLPKLWVSDCILASLFLFCDSAHSESGEMCAMKEVTLFPDDAKSRESAKQLMQVSCFSNGISEKIRMRLQFAFLLMSSW